MNKSTPIRQVAIDIETTGAELAKGHRVIEVAAVEMVDRDITGRFFQRYINPEREIDPGAQEVHGISRDFLDDKSVFREIAQEFIDFVKGAELLIHNAPFHLTFLNGELGVLRRDYLDDICPKIVDTLQVARTLRPDQRNGLDALCSEFEIETDIGGLVGSLLDANLVARIYLGMSPQLLH